MLYPLAARLLGAVVLPAVLANCASLRPADRAAWTEDFDALLVHLPAGYANLEYSLRTAGLDAESLATSTRARLAAARTARAGRAAISDFIKAFGDGHGSVRDPAPAPRTTAPRTVNYTSCKSAGYGGRNRNFHASLRAQPGFRADDAGAFAVAQFTSGARTVYAVRIPLFSQEQFPDICEALWSRHANAGGTCDQPCAIALWRAVGDSAIADLRARLTPTGAAGDGVLVVDITGNGGGTEWVLDVVRALASRPVTLPAVGMVRHDHWRAALQRRLARDTSAQARAYVNGLLSALDTPCDWSGVWRGGALPSCSPLVIDSLRGAITSTAPAWRGRLLIVTDERTASAAEEFAAMLLDSGAAGVAGTRTYGAGCGHTYGGINFRLPRSGLVVRLPDCARFRRDGTNERAGVRPNAGVWAPGDNDAARARAIAKAVAEVVAGR